MEGTCVECSKVGPLARRDLCGACYQRHWKAGTLPSIPKAATAPRVARECEHPGHPHRHGTRVAYVLDRCRCEPCTAANRDDLVERWDAIRNNAFVRTPKRSAAA